jgi:hypothetical protein
MRRFENRLCRSGGTPNFFHNPIGRKHYGRNECAGEVDDCRQHHIYDGSAERQDSETRDKRHNADDNRKEVTGPQGVDQRGEDGE